MGLCAHCLLCTYSVQSPALRGTLCSLQITQLTPVEFCPSEEGEQSSVYLRAAINLWLGFKRSRTRSNNISKLNKSYLEHSILSLHVGWSSPPPPTFTVQSTLQSEDIFLLIPVCMLVATRTNFLPSWTNTSSVGAGTGKLGSCLWQEADLDVKQTRVCSIFSLN